MNVWRWRAPSAGTRRIGFCLTVPGRWSSGDSVPPRGASVNENRRYGGMPTMVGPVTGRRVQGSSLPWSDPVSATEYLAGLSGYELSGAIEDPGTRRITAITDGL